MSTKKRQKQQKVVLAESSLTTSNISTQPTAFKHRSTKQPSLRKAENSLQKCPGKWNEIIEALTDSNCIQKNDWRKKKKDRLSYNEVDWLLEFSAKQIFGTWHTAEEIMFILGKRKVRKSTKKRDIYFELFDINNGTDKIETSQDSFPQKIEKKKNK